MRLLPLLFAAALLGGCSTPDSRIADNRTLFDQLPAEAQEKIRAGQVAVGFTPPMVELALGKPDGVFTHRTEQGDIEVWSYLDHSPQFSIGIGVGSSNHGSGVAGGVGVSTTGHLPGEKVRVEFRAGRVTTVALFKH
jgi:hypothetical protein